MKKEMSKRMSGNINTVTHKTEHSNTHIYNISNISNLIVATRFSFRKLGQKG